jgi:hypothetical protein
MDAAAGIARREGRERVGPIVQIFLCRSLIRASENSRPPFPSLVTTLTISHRQFIHECDGLAGLPPFHRGKVALTFSGRRLVITIILSGGNDAAQIWYSFKYLIAA